MKHGGTLTRRRFLGATFPACSLICAGFGFACAPRKAIVQQADQNGKHKFQLNWTRTYEEAFNWRYSYYIGLMERFSEYLGREELIEMIKRGVDEYVMASASDDPDFSFPEMIRAGKEMFRNMMTWEIIEETERVYEIHVTECLWAKVFQEYDAADIGYATVCHSDFASARAAHPGVRLERTKTIMQGNGFCNHRWMFEG